jgi:hypothetical protein
MAAADLRGARRRLMTMCLGANLGDAVVLAADGRRTVLGPAGGYDDALQKLVKITDTLWSAGAGNLALTAYLQAVLAERVPNNVHAYLNALQPLAQTVLRAHADLYKKLADQPGQAGISVMSALLVGGFDPASGRMVLFGFGSGNGYEPHLMNRPCIGGRPQDQALAGAVLATALAAPTPDGVANACRVALLAVAEVNPEIGPTGHVVIVRRTGSELRSFG